MFIVSSYELFFNNKTLVTTIISAEAVACPLCGGQLKYRNSRLRRRIDLAGTKSLYLLRRFLCAACRKLHTEVPDIIQPFKHYDSHTIQSVLDGREDAEASAADESTMRRWKGSFAEAEPDIGQRLASSYAKATDVLLPFGAGALALARIKAGLENWLAFVMALLINGGHAIRTRFAFCPPPFACRIETWNKTVAKGDVERDKTTGGSG
jgi:hypothetical protein